MMPDDFCPEHGYEFMKYAMGNPVPYCAACDDAAAMPVGPAGDLDPWNMPAVLRRDANNIAPFMDGCVPFPLELLARAAELVEGIEVDLDAPIEGEVALPASWVPPWGQSLK